MTRMITYLIIHRYTNLNIRNHAYTFYYCSFFFYLFFFLFRYSYGSASSLAPYINICWYLSNVTTTHAQYGYTTSLLQQAVSDGYHINMSETPCNNVSYSPYSPFIHIYITWWPSVQPTLHPRFIVLLAPYTKSCFPLHVDITHAYPMQLLLYYVYYQACHKQLVQISIHHNSYRQY